MLFKYVTNIRIRVRIRGYLLTGIRICIRVRGASLAGIRIRIRIRGYANFDIRSISISVHFGTAYFYLLSTPLQQLLSIPLAAPCSSSMFSLSIKCHMILIIIIIERGR